MPEDPIKPPPGYGPKTLGLTPPTGYKPKSPEEISQGFDEVAKDAPPYVGRLAVNSLPFVGSFAGPEGTVVGSTISAILRKANPKLFGQAPEGAGLAGEMAWDVLGQNIIPSAVGKGVSSLASTIAKGKVGAITSPALRNFPAVREGVSKELTGQLIGKYQFPESNILESAAENAADSKSNLTQNVIDAFNAHPGSADLNPQFYPKAVKEALLEHDNTFGKNTVGTSLVKLGKEFQLGGDVAKSQTYKSIANTALSDLTHARNFKIATGEGKTLEQLAVNKLITNGFKDSEGTLNTKYILDELGGKNSEIYQEAIGGKTLQNFKDLVGEIEKQKSGHEISDKIINWSKGHLMWSVPMAAGGILEGGHLGGVIGTMGTAASGAVLTNSMLAKAISNPQTAKLVVQAMRTPASAPQASLLQKMIVNSLKVAEVPATVRDE